jgi:hypothetical protein
VRVGVRYWVMASSVDLTPGVGAVEPVRTLASACGEYKREPFVRWEGLLLPVGITVVDVAESRTGW